MLFYLKTSIMPMSFPGGSVIKNLLAVQEIQETRVQSLVWEDLLEEEMATHSSSLENSMDRGAWWAIVHGVEKSWTPLSN